MLDHGTIQAAPAAGPRRRRRLRRPSPALVVAGLALLVALGGTSYAAVALPPRSVGTLHLAAGAVTSVKVRDASLRIVDLSPATRAALEGDAGPKGDRGDPGVGGLEFVGASSIFDSSPKKTLVVECPPGKRLVGGGAGAWLRAMIDVPTGVALTASHPLDERTWLAAAHEIEPTEQTWFLRANAVCAVDGG